MKLIRKLDMRLDKNKKYKRRWGLFYCGYCKKEVEKRYQNGLKYKSCGCYSHQLTGEAFITHGDSKKGKVLRLYRTYHGMKERCYNKNKKSYKNYGGRGIKVCEEWLSNYVTFKKWALKNGYKNNLTIDRKNNNGNYEPCNCRFVTRAINNENRNVTKLNYFKAEIIRKLRKKYNMKIKTIALLFNVRSDRIYQVLHNKCWIVKT